MHILHLVQLYYKTLRIGVIGFGAHSAGYVAVEGTVEVLHSLRVFKAVTHFQMAYNRFLNNLGC
jgi:hypothetical protein